MTTEAPGAASRLWRGFNRGWRRFRRWRRGRPFWGGLFLTLGGVQLFLSTQLNLAHVEISFGSEGFLAIVLPVVLVACGVLLCVTPQHRYFYSIIGTVTAVYSLLGLNLGGWFLGMLLGILGGALGFSWTPVQASPTSEPEKAEQPPPDDTDQLMSEPDDRPTEDLTGPLLDETPGQDQQAPVQAPRHERRDYAAVTLPLLLIAALVTPAAAPDAVSLATPTEAIPQAPTGADRLSGAAAQIPCLIPILCPDEDDEDDEDEDPEPDPSGSPSPTPSGEPEPSPGPSEDPDDQEPDDQDADDQDPDGQEPEPTPEEHQSPPEPRQADASVPPVQSQPSRMTTSRLQMETFAFEGVEVLNEDEEGKEEIPAMRFSFTYSESADFKLVTSGPEAETVLRADPLILRGDDDRKVTFYASRFEGLLGIIPISLTPDSPLLAFLELADALELRPDVVFTNVDLGLVYTEGAELLATDLNLG